MTSGRTEPLRSAQAVVGLHLPSGERCRPSGRTVEFDAAVRAQPRPFRPSRRLGEAPFAKGGRAGVSPTFPTFQFQAHAFAPPQGMRQNAPCFAQPELAQLTDLG
jgi:hypothetical protein